MNRAKQTTWARRDFRMTAMLTDLAIEHHQKTGDDEQLQDDVDRIERYAYYSWAHSAHGTETCFFYVRKTWAEYERAMNYQKGVTNAA